MIPKYEHIITPYVSSTSILKSAQHCLYNSGKDRCTRYMWSNDMFVLWNCNDISSNVMWTIRNQADKTFVRIKKIECLIRNISIRVYGVICSIIDKRL